MAQKCFEDVLKSLKCTLMFIIGKVNLIYSLNQKIIFLKEYYSVPSWIYVGSCTDVYIIKNNLHLT